jgi:hydroxymethylpyrimidine/phosphomethylpyrimidine kinase
MNTPVPYETAAESEEDDSPTPVMCFNVLDATGASGLAADILAVASSGGHAMPVATGILVRDTAQVVEFIEHESETVDSQARTVLEDMDVALFRIGFAGSPEALASVAEITADYEEIPVLTQLPTLTWWERDKIEEYLDALAELVLPQTSVLVGNYEQLWHWLLPEWQSTKKPSARDIAAAAAQHGVPYLVVTGMNMTQDTIETVVATPESIVMTITLERLDANFMGAGDTFCASIATLLAGGDELTDAVKEASIYVNRSLMAGFVPGMGAAVPDRMFWAQVDDESEEDATEGEAQAADPADLLGTPPTHTKH